MHKIKNGFKILIFLVIVLMLFIGTNFILRPFWEDNTNYDTIYGFYEEPVNTIETLFLGTSVTAYGIIPIELYENFGICSYNFGTQGQPMMASYYWLEEVYNFHSETLDTVVLDVSELKQEQSRKDLGEDSYYIKAFEYMKFSKVKYHFLKDFSDDFTEFISYMIPAVSFHDRWKEISNVDFFKHKYEPQRYLRGYGLQKDILIEQNYLYTDISVPFYNVTDQTDIKINNEDLLYFTKIIEFCNDHNMQLVLIKTPQNGTNPWSDAAHNTVQLLADQYQLDFIDFNYLPYIDELSFNFATDSSDNIHMNYYGAVKVTNWMGEYLVESCGNKDVRGDEKYDFMEEELTDYYRNTIFSDLDEITDPAEYLSNVLQREDYAVFIAVKDDACDSLTEEQREAFEAMGLNELSQLTSHASYLAVIDDGRVITEQVQSQDQDFIDSVNADETGEKTLYISCEGKLEDGLSFSMESGGYWMGNVSSIQLDGIEYSPNKRGLNIVVYDKRLNKVIDQASFDTYASPDRDKPVNEETLEETINSDGTGALSGKLLELYRYDRLCEDTRTADVLKQDTGEENLTAYLKAFWDNKEFNIYLSLNGDIANALTNLQREELADMGLTELSELADGDSYVAVIREGKINTEQCDPNGADLEESGEIYKLCSGGSEGESKCSLMIRGTEYVGETEGLNIVIYDNVLDQVVDSTVYDINHFFVSN